MTNVNPEFSPASRPTPLPSEQLTAILNAEVARYASKGWTVSSVQGQ